MRQYYTILLVVAFLPLATIQAGTLYGVSEGTGDVLESFDPVTLTRTPIGPLGTSFAFGGLAYDSNNSIMYMAAGRGNNNLFTVNLNTGAASLVGFHGVNDLFGLAYDSTNNKLYGSQFSGGSSLFELNTTTGSATLIGNMGSGMGGLTYDSTRDRLIGVNDGSGQIFDINRSNASKTLLASPGSNNDSGLAYDSEQDLFWNLDFSGRLFSLDPNNGFARTLHLSSLGSHDGLAFVSDQSPIPEPSTSILLLFGIIALGYKASAKKSLR